MKPQPAKPIIKILRAIFLTILWIFLLSSVLQIFMPNWTKTDENWNIVRQNITEQKVDLSQFVKMYNEWKFKQITSINDIKLEWILTDQYATGQKQEIFSLWTTWKKVYSQDILHYIATKPADLKFWDLWISLTWSTLVKAKYESQTITSRFLIENFLSLFFTIILFVLLFRFLMPKGGAWGLWSLMGWNGRMKNAVESKTTFAEVAWMDESKNELEEVVDFLKNPEKYKAAWAKIPRWVLLYWPPGWWKTLLARAVAWEAWVPFFVASWSEFMEMLVGLWAAKVRELFTKAKAQAPAIIFIDEIDTIGRKRWLWASWGHQEQEQTLNQILTEMDGFDKETNVIVIAATNRLDILDPALLRTWRFDRKVYIWTPTLEERILILNVHFKNKRLDPGIDMMSLARRTSGLVWADLENIANEAALRAAKDWRTTINAFDIEYALEKSVMWPEKKIKSMSEKERNTIAYHELGHAVTSYFSKDADPVEKISIVPRWLALWVTWMMPKEDARLYSKAKFLDEMVVMLGGRAAETVFFWKENITTWASNDFERVTRIASDMITKYWMDEDLGPVVWKDENRDAYATFKPFSEKTSQIIDEKVTNLIKDRLATSIKIIDENKEKIHQLAKLILIREYISKEEFFKFMEDDEALEKAIQEAKIHFEDMKQQEQKIQQKLHPEQKKPSIAKRVITKPARMLRPRDNNREKEN